MVIVSVMALDMVIVLYIVIDIGISTSTDNGISIIIRRRYHHQQWRTAPALFICDNIFLLTALINNLKGNGTLLYASQAIAACLVHPMLHCLRFINSGVNVLKQNWRRRRG